MHDLDAGDGHYVLNEPNPGHRSDLPSGDILATVTSTANHDASIPYFSTSNHRALSGRDSLQLRRVGFAH